jgi:hypothetical protein
MCCKKKKKNTYGIRLSQTYFEHDTEIWYVNFFLYIVQGSKNSYIIK